MKINIKLIVLICIVVCVNQSLQAQVRLPQLVSDGMVLQRDAKINIWGWASPGEKISIKFHDKKYTTTTSTDGKWSVILHPMKSGGPYQMNISGSNHIIIHNILIGDVWFCSGQSNMVLPMERVKEKYPDEISKADYPKIRNFFIPTVSDVSHVATDLPKSKWMVCDSNNVLQFGAASYFFAKQLFNKYHVPIGIINSSVGGTPIQAWISANGIKDIKPYNDRVIQLRDTAYLNHIQRIAMLNNNEARSINIDLTDKGLTEDKPWFDTTYQAINWHNYWLPGYWADQGIKGLNGIVWFRKEVNIPASMAGKPAKLFMGRIVDADYAYANGTLVGSTTYQYPPRRYQVPSGVLKAGKNLIVIKVINTFGKGGFVPDKHYFLSVGKDTIDLRGDWQYKVGEVFEPSHKAYIESFSVQNEPAGLYNTMVAPVINYTIKGIVWYQGEANTNRPAEYKSLLPALINDWRKNWNEGNIPFIYAQLPNFMEVQYSPSESQWAELRYAQLKTLAVPNTAMSVNIDAGEWNDIHPLDKKDVGDRLALTAEKLAYGDAGLVSSGPIYQSATVDGNKIIISFTNTGSGLIAKNGSELAQFAIAGADKKYIWAKAIIKNNQVIVWSDAISHPVYVRYAWADNPEGANLYNNEGLPASPFSTDPDQ
jgi:sialate O-acetylesterase